MLTPFQKMHGMTLIELMVAVAIFGLLMALGSASFSNWMQNLQTRTAAEAILNGVQVARSEAVKRNMSTIFVLCDVAAGGNGSSWDVLAASAPGVAGASGFATACGADSGSATGWERVQQRSAQEGSRNAIVTVTNAAGANAVAFSGMGRVVTPPMPNLSLPPSGNAINQGITGVTVNNPKGDRSLSITVAPGGSVRMCDPSPSLAATDPRRC